MQLLKLCSFISIFILFYSCSSSAPQGKTEAESIYREAVTLVEGGRYILATEKLNHIKSKFPYSFYSTHAELLLADILFLQENYAEAAAAYILFRDLHPKNEKLGYVILRIAESYFMQIPSTYDRDLSAGDEAIKYYEEILSKYPDSEYLEKSKTKIDKIKAMKAQKDVYIADFYFKTKVYDAAIYRYSDILSIYNDKKVKEHASMQIVLSYFYKKDFQQCLDYEFDEDTVGSEVTKKINLVKDDCRKKIKT